MSDVIEMMNTGIVETVDQKALELAKDFSYDGYQVVRREMFAHLREPAVVIRKDSVTFNTACIAGLEDVVYIHILVNQEDKRMVVRKCDKDDKDALRWCVDKPDKRKSRKMTNRLFSAMMYEQMGWNTNCRYKILGHKITYGDETIYIFDLTETEIFIDTRRKKKETGETAGEAAEKTDGEATSSNEDVASEPQGEPASEDGSAKKQSRTPFYPNDWKNSFGLPVEEHKKALEIRMLDDYVQFATPSQ
jgi:hypothetical protein